MRSYLERLARLEVHQRGVRLIPPADLSAAVHALVAATPLRAGERAELLRALLQRVRAGDATEDDLSVMAGCGLDLVETVRRLEASS